MSNTKIVIDKEHFNKLMKIAKTVCVNELNIPRLIIDLDSSINDRAKIFSTNNLAQQSYAMGCQDQQIIEQLRGKEKVSELNKCFEKGNQECDGAHCQGCWKDIVRSVIKSLTK